MSALVTRATRASRIAGVVGLALAGGLAALPWFSDIATERLIGEFMVYLALATLWNLLAGYAGLVSVGQQAFVGLGAYVLISLVTLAGWNPLMAVPAAGLTAALVAGPVAALLFRLQGAYFAIGAWVVAEVFRLVCAQIAVLGGGSGTSLPAAAMRGIAASRPEREAMLYWLALLLGLGAVAMAYGLLRTRLGLALTAIRDNEVAADSLGIRIERVKLLVYVLVAGATGMVGALIELQKVRMSPDAAFSVNDWTAFVIFIVVIGGIGSIEGPILGTLIYFALREYLAGLGPVYLLILGALAIVTMLLAPRGLWGLIDARFRVSLFPTGYRVREPHGEGR